MKKTVNPYISLNPYRIIGVHSNSGVKEIHKNLSRLKAYAQLGKKVDFIEFSAIKNAGLGIPGRRGEWTERSAWLAISQH